MIGLPNEDEYWERRREELENPKEAEWWDDEVVYEEGNLFLDEEIEALEKEYGCRMVKLSECELLDIVLEFCGISAHSAEWNDGYGCISYKYCA